MEPKLNIVIPENASYDEVVDTIADVLEVGFILEQNLSDGFQIRDLLSAISIQPTVNEVIDDFPVFADQFMKLNGETAQSAIAAVRQRILDSGGPLGPVTKRILTALTAASKSYDFAIHTYVSAQEQYQLWQTVFSGGDIWAGRPDGN